MPDLKLPLTRKRIDALPFAAAGAYLARDTERRGFFVKVGRTSKTYMIQADLNGRSTRWKIGDFPDMSVEDARAKAYNWLTRIRRGESPTAQSKGADGPTLFEAWQRYEEAHLRRKGRGERTIAGYRDSVQRVLRPLLNRSMAELGREPRLVIAEHDRITREHGRYAANGAARVGRAIYNHARKSSPALSPVNPFSMVDWNQEVRRDTGMGPEDLAGWWAQLQQLPNPVRRAFHLFTLLSGSRPGALTVARWCDVSVRRRILHVPKPKGGARKAFDIPLSRAMLRCLAYARREGRVLYGRDTRKWVFPADSASGHIVEYKEHRATLPKWGNNLRQTYRTLAQAAGLSELDAHLLMNHSMPSVNAGYIT